MKKLLLILAIMTSGICFAQTEIQAVSGVIQLIPDKVVIPSTNEYVYLVKTKSGYALFVSKNAELYERFSTKGSDSSIVLEGAVFKPLQHYTKKQWKRLSKKIKIFFPSISYKELEKIDMYLVFNYDVVLKGYSAPETTAPKPDPRSKGGKREVGPDGLPN